MRAASPIAPPSLPVVDGSTTFPQANAGGRCWSTILKVEMQWTGSRWRVADVPGSLNEVLAGDTVVIPKQYNLRVDSDLIVDGDLVADGNITVTVY